jgi:hypothetical protein
MAELGPTAKRSDACVIGIDCPPGEPRPGEVLPKVLARSGLRVADFDRPTKLMGAWIWTLKDDPTKRAIFLVKRALFRDRLVTLLEQRLIRGAMIAPDGLRMAWNSG